ncbi:MAG: DUF2207 domain-containing protein [archaeon]|nr:DUF2207 domain-containing protein [archaeon]
MGSLNIINTMFIILPIILLVSLIVPVYIYMKHSRRSKVDYDKKYESQIPSNMMLMFINSIFKKGRTVGEPTNEGLEATILHLLNKGHLKLDGNNILKVNKSENELLPFEENVISLFSNFEENGVIDLTIVNDSLKDVDELKFFKIKYNKVLNTFKEGYIRFRLTKMFNSNGAYRLRLYAVIIILISLFLLYFSFNYFLSFALFAKIIAIVFIIFALVLIFLPDRYGGNWTSEGKLENLKWQNFRKFYKNEKLINEDMLSLDKWDDMIVYAHALGDKDKILKVMQKTDITSYDKSNLVNFLVNGGYDELKKIFKAATASRFKNPSKNK